MNILFLRGFNNYFNRKVKLYSTLNDYRTHSSSYIDYSNINFNPNDGVATELIIGCPTQLEDNNLLIWDTIGAPDYAVCYEENNIKSRWFIIEVNRTRNGQYSVSLKRDSVVDNLNIILDAPCFIKKAKITNPNNPLIFNKEGSTYNQIKQSETLLTDNSKVPWIVGYIPRDHNFTGAIKAETIYTGSADLTVNGLSNWAYYDYYDSKNKYSVIDNATIETAFTAVRHTDVTGRYPTSFDTTVNVVGYISWLYNGNSTYRTDPSLDTTVVSSTQGIATTYTASTDPTNARYAGNWVNTNRDMIRRKVFQAAGTAGNTNFTYDKYLELLTLDGKTLLDTSNNKYYQITLYYGEPISGINVNGTVYTPVVDSSGFGEISKNGYAQIYSFTSRRIYIELTEQHTYIETTIPNNRYHLNDQPYDMFCMPYGDIDIYSNGSLICHNNKDAAFNIATQISNDLGDGAIYDIQLLPYCPMQYIITSNGDIDYGDLIANTITSSQNAVVYSVMFWASASQFSFNINQSIEINKQLVKNIMEEYDTRNIIDTVDSFDATGPNIYEYYYTIPASEFINMGIPAGSLETIDIKNIVLDELILDQGEMSASNITLSALRVGSGWQIKIDCYSQDALNTNIRIELSATLTVEYIAEDKVLSLKVSNETDLYRLCSPNWSGYFDFSVAKMGGVCEFFHVDCSYKPYQPYIHITPNFSGLYGQNKFNNSYDARGLILGGDFSLPQLANAWANYTLNNKNYQLIFDRQMQNLDVNNKYQQENDIFGAITGTIQGTTQGAMTGAMAGGGWGALAGAIIGGGSSAVAGVIDINRNAALRRENKQYQIDQFNYSLGNIQAVPSSLTKVSALNNNNKLFPVLEYYTCTNEEKEILKNNLKYDGYTIMAIGTLRDYNEGYFKGDIIRLDSLNDDSHIADDIYAEIGRGIYLN